MSFSSPVIRDAIHVGGPPPAARLVELHDRDQLQAACTGHGQFGFEQIAARHQHIQIVGQSALVAQFGEAEDPSAILNVLASSVFGRS